MINHRSWVCITSPSIFSPFGHLPIPTHTSYQRVKTYMCFLHFFMLSQGNVKHIWRKTLFIFFHIHDLTDACNWLVSHWLTGEKKNLMPSLSTVLFSWLQAMDDCGTVGNQIHKMRHELIVQLPSYCTSQDRPLPPQKKKKKINIPSESEWNKNKSADMDFIKSQLEISWIN